MPVIRIMSRLVEVIHSDGTVETAPLSIADLHIDNGIIAAVTVKPFVKETAGVLYRDTPLRVRIGSRFEQL